MRDIINISSQIIGITEAGAAPRPRAELQSARLDLVSDEDFVRLALQRSTSPHRDEALRRFDRLMAGLEME